MLITSRDDHGQESQNRTEQGQRHAGIAGIKFFGQDRGVEQPFTIAAERGGDQFAQETRRDHILVNRTRGQETVLGRGQVPNRPAQRAELRLGELPSPVSQGNLPGAKREVDRHGSSWTGEIANSECAASGLLAPVHIECRTGREAVFREEEHGMCSLLRSADALNR